MNLAPQGSLRLDAVATAPFELHSFKEDDEKASLFNLILESQILPKDKAELHPTSGNPLDPAAGNILPVDSKPAETGGRISPDASPHGDASLVGGSLAQFDPVDAKITIGSPTIAGDQYAPRAVKDATQLPHARPASKYSVPMHTAGMLPPPGSSVPPVALATQPSPDHADSEPAQEALASHSSSALAPDTLAKPEVSPKSISLPASALIAPRISASSAILAKEKTPAAGERSKFLATNEKVSPAPLHDLQTKQTAPERVQTSDRQLAGVPVTQIAATLAEQIVQSAEQSLSANIGSPFQPTAAGPASSPQGGVQHSPGQQIETLIDSLVQARESGRIARGDVVLRHAEFGAVMVTIDRGDADLRAVISSRDPGFAPAAQAALADRALPAAPDSSSAQSRQQDQTQHQGQSRGSGFNTQPDRDAQDGRGGPNRSSADQTGFAQADSANDTQQSGQTISEPRQRGLFA